MKGSLYLTTALCAIFLCGSHGKPTEIVADADPVLDPVVSSANNHSEAVVETAREQRSPQFGLLGNYGDYSDYDDSSRQFGNKRKPYHYKPYQHKPHGGHGCRSYGCGGWQPDYGGHGGHGGASFASASAGSVGGGGPYGGHSGANAQSASFSIGPFSASFSAAQASSGNGGF